MAQLNVGSGSSMAKNNNNNNIPPNRKSIADKIDSILAGIENAFILVSYAVLILLVGGETIRRAFTQEQAVWGPEVAIYAFVWLSWFSMAKHGRYGTHLAFSEIRNGAPEPVRRFLEVIDCLLWLVLGSIVIVTSYAMVENSMKMDQVIFGTRVPVAWANLAVPVGWGFSMLRILQRLWLVICSWDRLKTETAPDSMPSL